MPHHQITFDNQGNPATEASYQLFKDYDGIEFPGLIDIKRPQEEYDIRLIMVKLTLNQPITEDQFALQQPVGSMLVNLDERNRQRQRETGWPGGSAFRRAAPVTNAGPHH